eukprot:14547934-Alexandrium_andersonii.AAC.1
MLPDAPLDAPVCWVARLPGIARAGKRGVRSGLGIPSKLGGSESPLLLDACGGANQRIAASI